VSQRFDLLFRRGAVFAAPHAIGRVDAQQVVFDGGFVKATHDGEFVRACGDGNAVGFECDVVALRLHWINAVSLAPLRIVFHLAVVSFDGVSGGVPAGNIDHQKASEGMMNIAHRGCQFLAQIGSMTREPKNRCWLQRTEIDNFL
jgi:hypothetical protein